MSNCKIKKEELDALEKAVASYNRSKTTVFDVDTYVVMSDGRVSGVKEIYEEFEEKYER